MEVLNPSADSGCLYMVRVSSYMTAYKCVKTEEEFKQVQSDYLKAYVEASSNVVAGVGQGFVAYLVPILFGIIFVLLLLWILGVIYRALVSSVDINKSKF